MSLPEECDDRDLSSELSSKSIFKNFEFQSEFLKILCSLNTV